MDSSESPTPHLSNKARGKTRPTAPPQLNPSVPWPSSIAHAVSLPSQRRYHSHQGRYIPQGRCGVQQVATPITASQKGTGGRPQPPSPFWSS